MGKRIRDLDATAGLTGTHKIAVDKTGLPEAEGVTLDELSTHLATALDESSALTAETAARVAGDSALDVRLDAIEALGSLATDAELAAHVDDTAAAHAASAISAPAVGGLAAGTVASQLSALERQKQSSSVPGTSIILAGDSITAMNYGPSLSGEPEYLTLDSAGFWNQANVMLGHRLTVVGNAGIPGNTSAQLLARFAGDVLSTPSDWVCILIGRNDSPSDVAGTIANITAMVTAARADGRHVLLCTVLPADSGVDNIAKKLGICTLNAWIKNYARSTPGVVVADTAATVVDMTASTFVASTGMLADGIHPSPKGACAMGRAIADVLSPLLPASDPLLASTPGDPLNLLANPLVNGTGTGTPSSWATDYLNGGSRSWVARTDGVPGKWYQTVLTAGGSVKYTCNLDVPGSIAVGDTLRFAVEFELDTLEDPPVDYQSISAYLQCWDGASFPAAGKAWDLYWDATRQNFKYPLPGGVLCTPPIVAPAGTTIVQVAILVFGAGNYRFGRASLRGV